MLPNTTYWGWSSQGDTPIYLFNLRSLVIKLFFDKNLSNFLSLKTPINLSLKDSNNSYSYFFKYCAIYKPIINLTVDIKNNDNPITIIKKVFMALNGALNGDRPQYCSLNNPNDGLDANICFLSPAFSYWRPVANPSFYSTRISFPSARHNSFFKNFVQN